MKTHKKACLLLLAFLLAVMPFALLAGTAAMRGARTVFGYRFLSVQTSSMAPAINRGDMIVVKSCAPERVRVGDDITYAAAFTMIDNEVLITHRVKEIYTELDGAPGLWFVTQGVGNETPDYEPVGADQLVGKVVMRLPGAGAALGWINGHFAISLLAAVPLGLLSWFAATLLAWLALRQRGLGHT